MYKRQAIESESVNWLIENEMSYSDYSRYTQAFNVLNKNTTDVSGFALINYKTGWVLSLSLIHIFPTLIVACIVAVIGILMWVCGIILSVLVKKHRQLFELYLNSIKR